MDEFYYELIFFLFALLLRIAPVVALCLLLKLIHMIFRKVKAHRRNVREREARKAEYRRRSALYRKEISQCYLQE